MRVAILAVRLLLPAMLSSALAASGADTLMADSLATDTLTAGAIAADTLAADTLVADTLVADTLAADTLVPPRAATAPAQAVPPPGGDTAGSLELDEKTVKGRSTAIHRQKEISRIRLGREELQKVAAAQGDPFKVLATLPGVSNQNDMSVRPFVRGGKAEETQVLWEGIPLLQPYHFASVYSIFNMEALEDMTLYSGGFPARVGNALSGAIFMRSRPAPLDSFRLFADLSVLRGLGHVGIPLIKGRLGASYSYQAFWYDYAVDRGWDLLDMMADDSALSAQKRQFRSYMDLPNFRDHQFGLDWRAGPALTSHYTGIVSRDVFTVRDTKTRYYVGGGEVSPDYYDESTFYRPGDQRELRASWDSLAVVSVDNAVHAARFHWEPADRWEVDQAVAWQSQDWHVAFYDEEVWTEAKTPDGRFSGYRTPGPSQKLFQLENRTLDYRLDVRYSGDRHRLDLGLSQSLRTAGYHTILEKPIYDIIVHGSVDAFETLSYYDPGGFVLPRNAPLTDPRVNYMSQLADLVRFDHQGRQRGSFLGAYVSDEWNLDSRHRLTLGLRAETDTYAEDLFLSPRIGWFQALGGRDELTLASGLYSQGDFPFHLRAVSPGLRSEKAFHANAEWTHYFSRNYRLETQVYQKNYYDLVIVGMENTGRLDFSSGPLQRFDSAQFEALSRAEQEMVRSYFGERRLDYRNGGLGKAAGIEVSFFYDPNKVWSGWLSGETGYSRRLDRPGEKAYDFRQGRPWAFNWVNYFHMPSNYELSLRARFASGLPYTDYRASADGSEGGIGGAVDDGLGRGSDTLLYVGPRNGRRYSPYNRFDIRLSKEFRIRNHPLQSYFEIWNSFNSPNFIMADASTGKWKFIDLNYPVPILFLGVNFRW